MSELNKYISSSPELVFLENKTRRVLIAVFFRRPKTEFTVEDLSIITGENVEDIKREIKTFVDLDIVINHENNTFETNVDSNIIQSYMKFKRAITKNQN